jgi:hypothetical protein
MNPRAIRVLCLTACVLFAVKAQHTRQGLGTFALEQIERIFDVVEKVVNPA